MNSNNYSHRQKTARIRITGKTGAPVKESEVTVKQTKHEFLFGCAEFSLIPYVNGEFTGEKLAQAEKIANSALNLFNFVTLPFYWGGFEKEKGKPDTARLLKTAKWLKDKGAMVKGHPLCWHTSTAPWLLDMTNEEILKAQLNRINRDVSDFAGTIDMWDAINEVVIMPIFNKYDNGITRICKEHGRIKLVKKVFEAAAKANPNAMFLINDFDTSESYDILLEGLIESGTDIKVIGIQSHMHQGYWGKEKTAEVLERFSRFNLPIHFTEINMVSGDIMPKHIDDLNDFKVSEWPSTPEGELRQAVELSEFYKQLFEHKLVEAITYWSFTDGGWLNAPAGFLTKEGREKPVYASIYNLVKNEWFTNQKVVTDSEGFAQITGFKGEYKAEFDGGETEFTLK
ncbi:MAG: endo-1,4-beta-xylanase [Clostridiales bacterium]|jgi:GH35 family endo-1,4-beta-xylanase|nr:endo-1,4-beta-xylanase [Clostridiales bacterium]